MAPAPFARVARSVIQGRRLLTPMEKLAYCVLKSYDWHDEGCWPSRERLAADMGVSTDTVDRAIAGLVKAGLVEKRRRGRGLTNTYLLRAPDSAPVRTLDSAPVRHEVDAVEIDEKIKITEVASQPRRDEADQEKQRLEIVERLRDHVLPLLDDADDRTELTWRRIALRAKQPIDPGVADWLETKLTGEPGFTHIPPAAGYVTRVLQEHAAGYTQGLPWRFREATSW